MGISKTMPAFFLILMSGVGCKNNTNANDNLYGIYRVYSDNAQERMFLAGQDTYLKLNPDRTIVYNTTINNKPRFHFEGSFTVNKEVDSLIINWKSGKLPGRLKVEKQGTVYKIRIGQTTYVKDAG